MMTTKLLFLSSSLVMINYSLVLAQDCHNVRNKFDKMICSNPEIRHADDDMSRAYFRLLKSTSDHDMREGIIASQRRWIRARSSDIEPSADMDKSSQTEKDLADRQAIVSATKDRQFQLMRRTKDGRSYAMIEEMIQQKEQFSSYSGGPYQGFTTECSFLHPPFGDDYFCTSSISVQMGKHVCVRSLEWASGHQSIISIVGSITSGKFQQQAICEEGYGSNYPSCPDPDRAWVWPQIKRPIADALGRKPVGWDRSTTLDDSPLKGPVLKLDPEATFDGADEYENRRFLARCARSAFFPPASIRKNLASSHSD